MYELPTSIEINGQFHKITNEGDFRMVLDCFSVLEDVTISENERILCCLIIFYDELNELEDVWDVFGENRDEAVKLMFEFFNNGKPKSQSVGMNMDHKLVNWEKVVGKEIRNEKYIHWWTFLGYYMAMGDCLYATIIHIRDKIVKGKKLEKYEVEFKRSNPDYFNWDSRTAEQKENDEMIRNLWNRGGE
jgi:hypothetical protein